MPKPARPAAPQALPAVEPEAVHELYRDFLEADDDGASSNDITQILDDWFTGHGFATVLYRGRSARR